MTPDRRACAVTPLFDRDRPAAAVTGIGDLARSSGVTPRALRHYEDKGLIRSHRTRQGGRVFTPHQCEVARLVILLRGLDVAIVDIRRLVDASRSEGDRLGDLRRALETRAEDLARRLHDVRRILDDPGGLSRLGLVRSTGWSERPALLRSLP